MYNTDNQNDTVKHFIKKKWSIGYQSITNYILKYIQIPSSTQKLIQLIDIQLIVFFVLYNFPGQK